MGITMEITSREMVKPSSPTPTHLKTHKLSFLDQLTPSLYTPLIFFYHHHPQQTSQLLKQSLSKILSVFYPLGGTVLDDSAVECSDSGAEFIEARVHANVSDFIQGASSMEEIKRLLPVESLGEDKNVILKVRLNVFDCGGVAIAVCMWHKLGDGASFVDFINGWAATSRGETLIQIPNFNLASFFPPVPLSGALDPSEGYMDEKITTKRFVFDKERIERLREEYNGVVDNPTRVEVVSSYIWQRFIEVDISKVSSSLFAAVHAVNLRPKKSPPFPEHMFGNCYRPALAFWTPESGYSELLVKLRSAIMSVDDEFIRRVQSGAHEEDMKKGVDLMMSGRVKFCHFSSWCRFPTYEVDFGWGKPEWVCTAGVPVKNLVILMRTTCGEGIEAWINMLQDDIFELIEA